MIQTKKQYKEVKEALEFFEKEYLLESNNNRNVFLQTTLLNAYKDEIDSLKNK